MAGRRDEAVAVAERLEELASTEYVAATQIALIYAGLGDLDTAFEHLDRAEEQLELDIVFGRALFGPQLGHDPRFEALLKRAGVSF